MYYFFDRSFQTPAATSNDSSVHDLTNQTEEIVGELFQSSMVFFKPGAFPFCVDSVALRGKIVRQHYDCLSLFLFWFCCLSVSLQPNDPHFPVVAELLRVKKDELQRWLCDKKIKTKNETLIQHLRVEVVRLTA